MVCPHCDESSAGEGRICPSCGRLASGASLDTLRRTDADAETQLDPLPRPAPATDALTPGSVFGTRYRIVRMLGAGGMGVVYEAWDEEVGLPVALKLIRREVMADPRIAAEVEGRFKRELVLARQVTHRNVVRIHDLGHVEGVKYLTMPYIEGQTLAAALHTHGRLPVARTLAVMREVAAGLAAAHAVGVVHRDLKPENVMLDGDGHAIIMDFGISRSTAGEDPSGSDRRKPARGRTAFHGASLAGGMTIQGAVIGTLEYMAPEQARAEPVDERADIYAFGLIFRDALVGSIRMAGTSALDELRARMQAPPPATRSIDPAIPSPVDEIVCRCLEPDPSKRFQTTDELIAALNRIDDEGQLLPEPRRFGRRHFAAAAVLVMALVAGTWWLASRVPPPPPAPTSVLVTDFDVQGVEGLQGAVEHSLTIAMEGASFVTVFPQREARALAARLVPASAGRIDESTGRLIAQREGIKLMLAGSVSAGAKGVDVLVRAIDPANGNPVAEARRRASGRDGILTEIALAAEDVRARLGDTTPESERQAQRETFTAASLDAAREYSAAQELAAAYNDDEALKRYRRAIALDPNFGRAYAGAAYSASQLGRKEEAAELWKNALASVDRMTPREKFRTLGLYYGTVSRDYKAAITNYEELVKQYPADGAGHNNLALAYFSIRDFARAMKEGQRALDIYPRKRLYRGNYALYAMYGSEFEAARKQAEELLRDEPSYYAAFLPLAVAALARADQSAARDAYARMADTGESGASLAALGLADIAMYVGNPEEAVQILQGRIAEDERAGNQALIPALYVTLAEAQRGLNRQSPALAAARVALKFGRTEEIVVPVARTLLAANRVEEAHAIARALQSQFEPHRRAYGKLLEGEIAQRAGRPIEALEAFRAAQGFSDLWLVHLDLGVLYAEAGRYAEALSELDLCQKRRGEAAAIFLDDVPTFRYAAALPYWLGRAQEGLGMREPALASYQAYLSLRTGPSRDPLAADASRRLGSR
jgi:serine/threonine protein kinase/tetratricopeptide (TPR) repeat protein